MTRGAPHPQGEQGGLESAAGARGGGFVAGSAFVNGTGGNELPAGQIPQLTAQDAARESRALRGLLPLRHLEVP